MDVLSQLRCLSCPVSALSCNGYPAIIAAPTVLSGCPVLTVLSPMPCPSCPAPAIMGCPYMAFLIFEVKGRILSNRRPNILYSKKHDSLECMEFLLFGLSQNLLF